MNIYRVITTPISGVIILLPGIPMTIIVSVFSVKTIILLRDFQLTNPGDSYFYCLGLPGYMFLGCADRDEQMSNS